MPRKIFISPYRASVLALGVVLVSLPAHAGFLWNESKDASTYQAAPAGTSSLPAVSVSSEAGSMADGGPESVSPLVITGSVTAVPAPPSALQAAPTLRAPVPASAQAAPLMPSVSATSGAPTLSFTPVVPSAVPAPVPASLPTPVPVPVPAPAPSGVLSSAPAIVTPSLAAAPMATPAVALPPAVTPAPSLVRRDGQIDLSTETISVASSPQPGIVSDADIVQGFASQVPLALAMRQILPVNYSFSVDQGVDMGTLVSYKGGKPWSETLNTMLASAGLEARQQGMLVVVGRAMAPAVSPPVQTLPWLSPDKAQASVSIPTSKPTLNLSSAEGWSAERGETLRGVLIGWCNRAGVEIKWLAEYDYPIEASARFVGGFEDAVRNLFAGFDGARPQPVGELHINPRAGQSVLVVQARGNSYTN